MKLIKILIKLIKKFEKKYPQTAFIIKVCIPPIVYSFAFYLGMQSQYFFELFYSDGPSFKQSDEHITTVIQEKLNENVTEPLEPPEIEDFSNVSDNDLSKENTWTKEDIFEVVCLATAAALLLFAFLNYRGYWDDPPLPPYSPQPPEIDTYVDKPPYTYDPLAKTRWVAAESVEREWEASVLRQCLGIPEKEHAYQSDFFYGPPVPQEPNPEFDALWPPLPPLFAPTEVTQEVFDEITEKFGY